jgi:hypothetical protein
VGGGHPWLPPPDAAARDGRRAEKRWPRKAHNIAIYAMQIPCQAGRFFASTRQGPAGTAIESTNIFKLKNALSRGKILTCQKW